MSWVKKAKRLNARIINKIKPQNIIIIFNRRKELIGGSRKKSVKKIRINRIIRTKVEFKEVEKSEKNNRA